MLREFHNRYLFIFDLFLLPLALYLSYVLRLERFDLASQWPAFTLSLLAVISFSLPLFIRAGIYARYWPYASVGFLDDDPGKRRLHIQGMPVLGNRQALPMVVSQYGVKQAIIAMPTAAGKEIRHIRQLCEDVGIESRTIPGIYELVGPCQRQTDPRTPH